MQNAIVGNPAGFTPSKLDDLKDGSEEDKQKYQQWKDHMEKGLGRTLSDAEFAKLWKEQFESFCTKQPDGSYQGKTDYAHMMYTIAGCCVEDDAKGVDNSYPNWPVTWATGGKFWEDSETRKQFIGWLGDATFDGTDHSGISFGPDDYTADLDADNIRRRMENEGISYNQASAFYYADVKTNPKQRTQEFKENNSYSSVEKAVLDAAGVSSLNDLKAKDGWEGSYDFLESIKNDDPTLQDY